MIIYPTQNQENKMAKTEAPKQEQPELSVDEVRAAIGDFQKSVTVEIGVTSLDDTLDGFVSYVKAAAEEAGLTDFRMKYRTSGYSYSKGSWSCAILLIGKRPYTDDEIRKEGAKLIQRKKRAEAEAVKRRAGKLKKLNRLNRELGLPEVAEVPAS